MRVVFRLLSLLTWTFFGACASAVAEDVHVNTGVICDTEEQVERFVAHYTGDLQIAVSAVNAAEHDATACGVVTMAYVRVAVLTTVRNRDSAYHVVQIVVLGIVTHQGLQIIRPERQYLLQAVDERVA